MLFKLSFGGTMSDMVTVFFSGNSDSAKTIIDLDI